MDRVNAIPVSIGISVFNEEKNINTLVTSILSQEEVGFFIKELIIIDDGSTDGTAEKIEQIRDRRIRLISTSWQKR